MRSLRVRIAVVMIVVAGVAVAATALLFSRSVETAFERVSVDADATDATRLAEALAGELSRDDGLRDPEAALARIGAVTNRRIVLVDPSGDVLAMWPAATPPLEVQLGPNHTLRLLVEQEGTVQEIVLVNAPHAEVRAPGGGLVGTLYLGPPPDGGSHARFTTSITRSLVLVVAGVLVAILAATLLVTRKVVGPIEALTDATRRMERGDLSQRVEAPPGGEVGDLAHAFNAMADALERAEAARRAMVSDVAHELRTPLTNIRGHIEAMQDGLMRPDAETLASLHEEAMLLGRLVDDLRDLALADAGRLSLEREPVDVGPALERAAAAASARAAAAGVAVEAERPPVALRADADPVRLTQILRNLVDNAIAHTPEGGRVTIRAGRAASGAVEIAVTDTGEGIAPEHLPYVFDRFYRTDGSRTRATGGAGLGLAIVKQFAEAHGGAVRVESRPGRGATFTVTLPAAPS
jgi:signal transduction histidine kinase